VRRLLLVLLVVVAIGLPNVALGRAVALRLTAPHQSALATGLPNDSAVAVPQVMGQPAEPQLTAASWYAIDVATGTTLASHDATTERPIASVTKLATALVIVHDHPLNEQLTVPPLPTYAADDEILHLQAGERFSTNDLLAALLINSADDSADALALADSGTEAAFVAKMNQLVARWGIARAHFSNPSGLVDTGNGASAQAVAELAQLVLQNPTLRRLVDTPAATITDSAGRSIALTTTDELLPSGQFQGIKTGYTEAAGECFVGLTTIAGHQVITVVLGSGNRFGDTTTLANWIRQNYQWHTPH
jgi:D-alanyl-D-alanine carboxypeptidase (penicillin-binding protein 5/6)